VNAALNAARPLRPGPPCLALPPRPPPRSRAGPRHGGAQTTGGCPARPAGPARVRRAGQVKPWVSASRGAPRGLLRRRAHARLRHAARRASPPPDARARTGLRRHQAPRRAPGHEARAGGAEHGAARRACSAACTLSDMRATCSFVTTPSAIRRSWYCWYTFLCCWITCAGARPHQSSSARAWQRRARALRPCGGRCGHGWDAPPLSARPGQARARRRSGPQQGPGACGSACAHAVRAMG